VFTVGVGLTVTVNVFGVPTQLLAVGVMVMVAVIGAVVLLVAVNGAVLPVPLAPKPMTVLLFAHAKVAPETGDEKFTASVVAPLQ
jgi:hypothetical protein